MTKARKSRSARPFRRTPVPDLTGKGAEDTLTRAEVVALIAGRVPWGPADDVVTVRNRISSKLNYDAKHGKLLAKTRSRFTLGDVAVWAGSQWPGTFVGLIPQRAIHGVAAGKLPTPRVKAGGYSLPFSIETAHAELRAMHQRVAECEQALRVAKDALAQAGPKAKAWDDWNLKKRKRK